MSNWKMRVLSGVAIAMAASGAMAQVSTNQVATKTDWSVFTEENPKECWAVSKPKQTVNSRDGKAVSVKRGDILMFVTYRPASGTAGEISFTGGYPFAPGSSVSMNIGGTSFELFTEGEYAWPASPDEDAKILAAMKKGSQAVLTARSARGTKTEDTFSLLGFTAATDEAATRCK